MKGDFSRNSFHSNKHYRGVRMQQGRVQMDADWNEQIDITDHRDRLFTDDFLGSTIGPNVGAGFIIGVTPEQQDLTIGLGRYYVDGLLVENSSSLYFTNQTDYPQAVLPNQDGVYLTYLEVWQLSLSIADDADIAESALGGVDTATRLRTIAQVKLLPVDRTGISKLTFTALFDPKATLETPAYNNIQHWNALTNRLPSDVNAVQLLPDVDKMTSNTNATYHIQIHQGSSVEQATYKISSETPLVQVDIGAIDVDTNNVTVVNQPPDGQSVFAVGQWLELSTSARDVAKMPGDLVQITVVNNVVLTVSGIIGTDIIDTANNATGTATARRWQQNATPVAHSVQFPLEEGLAINFLGNTFENGSYWTIATDATRHTINWPTNNNQFIALPPNSVTISQLTPTVANSPTLQNQLYRVEIHQGSGNVDDQGNPIPPSFKWSRDNASVSSSITIISSNNITLATLPQDGISSFILNQWLELTTPARELTGIPGDMVQITVVNGITLTVSGDIGADITVANHAIARRWDTAVTNDASQAVNVIDVNQLLSLENGLSITFSGSDFQTGDYWLIPARAALNNQKSHIDWPTDDIGNYLMQLPNGIQCSYAPLAIVQRSSSVWNFESDARTLATPMVQLSVIGADPCAPANTIHVDCDGQVGISTNTPNAKLDIETSTGIAGQDAIHATAISSNGVAITAVTKDNKTAILQNNSTQPTLQLTNNGNGNGINVNVGTGFATSLTSNSSQHPTLYANNSADGPAIWCQSTSNSFATFAVGNYGNQVAADLKSYGANPTLRATNVGINGDITNTNAAAEFINGSSTYATLYLTNTYPNGPCLVATGNANITGSLTIGNTNSGSFSVTPAPNKIPVADESGHIDAGWLLVNSGIPVGTILAQGGATPDPGYLQCNGSAVSRTTYAALFARIGTRWGPGDGSTTFNLPPSGCVLIGAGWGGYPGLADSVGTSGGEALHTLSPNEMPAHNHSVTINTWTQGGPVLGFVGPGSGGLGAQTFTTAAAGNNAAHNNLQPTAVVLYQIKY